MGLEFNTKKSVCIALGRGSNIEHRKLILQNSEIDWVREFKYLGVNFTAGKALLCSITPTCKKFYSICNSILNQTKGNDEFTRLHLCESKCLPFLTYALPAVNLKKYQVQELNKAWNCIIRKIFGFNTWESVKLFLAGLGKLNFKFIRLKLSIKFLRNNLNWPSGVLRYLTLRHMLTDFKLICNDCDLVYDHCMFSSVNLSDRKLNAIIYDLFKKICQLDD